MKIGTMSTMFRDTIESDAHISYVESLERCKKAGFTAVDLNLCQICRRKSTLHTDEWKKEAAQIRETADRLDIELPQCHLPFKSAKVKWKTAEDYAYYVEMLYRAAEVAAFIGVPWAVIHPERLVDSGLSSAEKFRKTHEEYDKLIEFALSKNLNIAYENMIYRAERSESENYCSSAEELCELIDSYGDKRVGACWDTGHANMRYTDQWEPIHIVGKRLHCTHIDDNRRKDDLHLIPCQGSVNWKRVIAALKDIEYPGAFILELSANFLTPNIIKDEVARHAFAVTSLLFEL